MSRRLAILIGNGTFPRDPELVPLSGPANDIEGMARILRDQGGFEIREPFFLDESRDVIMSAIEETLDALGNDDVLLLFYAGHGKLDRLHRLCLATSETRTAALYSTSIPIRQLGDIFDYSICSTIILLLDCCYSGAAGAELDRDIDNEFKTIRRVSSLYLLSASTRTQTAREAEHGGRTMGNFTAAIVRGLELGEADWDRDGHVSLLDLHSYLLRVLRNQTPQCLLPKDFTDDPIIATLRPASPKKERHYLVHPDADNRHTISLPQSDLHTIVCPYCDCELIIEPPVAKGDLDPDEMEEQFIALPYARDVDIFDPEDGESRSKWTEIGNDFFRRLNYESIGILHMEEGWKVQYCVARCHNCNKSASELPKGLIDVFANFTEGEMLRDMWPHLLAKFPKIQLYYPKNILCRLSANNFFVLIALVAIYFASITPLYFQTPIFDFDRFASKNAPILLMHAVITASLFCLFYIKNASMKLFRSDQRMFLSLFSIKYGLNYWLNFALSRYIGYQKEGCIFTVNAIVVFGGLLSSLVLFSAWLAAWVGFLDISMSPNPLLATTELLFWLVASYLYGKLVWTLSVAPFYVLRSIRKIPLNLESSNTLHNLNFVEKICGYSVSSICVLMVTTILLSVSPKHLWVVFWAQTILILCCSMIIIRFHIVPNRDPAIKIVEATKVVLLVLGYCFAQYAIQSGVELVGITQAEHQIFIRLLKVSLLKQYAELLVFAALCTWLLMILGKVAADTLLGIKRAYLHEVLQPKYDQIRKLEREGIDRLAITNRDVGDIKSRREILETEINRKKAQVNRYFTKLAAKILLILVLFSAISVSMTLIGIEILNGS